MSVSTMLLQASVRWFEFLGLTTLLGSLAFRCIILRPSLLSRDESASFERFRLKVEASAIVLLALTSVAELIFRTTVMAGGRTNLSLAVPLVLRGTHYGTVWLARMGLVGMLGAIWLVGWRRAPRSQWFALLSLVVATLVTLTTTLSGHAADWGDITLPVLSDWLHLVAISTWIGGLFTLGFVLQPSLSHLGKGETLPRLGSIARRFSRMAACCATVFLATGFYNSWVQVASLSPLVSTAYGWTLLAKLALVAAALMLAGLNRYYFLPVLPLGSGTQGHAAVKGLGRVAGTLLRRRAGANGEQVTQEFGRSVRFEWLIAAGVLACSALLTQFPPARHIRSHQHRQPHAVHQSTAGTSRADTQTPADHGLHHPSAEASGERPG